MGKSPVTRHFGLLLDHLLSNVTWLLTWVVPGVSDLQHSESLLAKILANSAAAAQQLWKSNRSECQLALITA